MQLKDKNSYGGLLIIYGRV